MILVQKNATSIADSTKEQLLQSSYVHITEVNAAIFFLIERLLDAAHKHDEDKITNINDFYDNIKHNFQARNWLDNHYKISRHHIMQNNADDLNLLDVLEHIIDCIVAGMARSDNPYDPELSNEILQKAFKNTVKLIKDNITVVEVVKEK